ncbi:MAG: hypothetical protein ACRBK7_00255 [Acidimicrobiales bacterium]
MNRLTNMVPSGAKSEMASGNAKNEGSPILDRSRAQLRLPTDLVTETLRIAHVQSMPNVDPDSTPEPPTDRTVARLEKSGVLVDGVLDPIAFELLDVVNQASLIVAVDLHCMDDSSVPTVWSTPRQAVVSGTLDPDYIEFRPVAVSQLPQVLGELIVLRSPRFIGDVPISINSQILSKAKGLIDDREEALAVLTEGGLDSDQAVLALDIQRPDVRRWRITSTWSTDDGQETTELRGLDAGLSGHWLIGSTTGDDEVGQLTFTPQGHGEVMSAFRSVLPKNWMGTPLNRAGTEPT